MPTKAAMLRAASSHGKDPHWNALLFYAPTARFLPRVPSQWRASLNQALADRHQQTCAKLFGDCYKEFSLCSPSAFFHIPSLILSLSLLPSLPPSLPVLFWKRSWRAQ